MNEPADLARWSQRPLSSIVFSFLKGQLIAIRPASNVTVPILPFSALEERTHYFVTVALCHPAPDRTGI
jgi:hypothetical protein